MILLSSSMKRPLPKAPQATNVSINRFSLIWSVIGTGGPPPAPPSSTWEASLATSSSASSPTGECQTKNIINPVSVAWDAPKVNRQQKCFFRQLRASNSEKHVTPSVMSLQERAADVVLLPALHVRLAVHRDEFLVELLRLHLT